MKSHTKPVEENPPSRRLGATQRRPWHSPLTFRYLGPLCLVIGGLLLWFRCTENRDANTPNYDIEAFEHRTKCLYQGSFSRDFNDLNDIQLQEAQRIGINPTAGRDGLLALGHKLKEIHTCEYYVVDSLTHSSPYLIPMAARLLHEIGDSFVSYFKTKGLPVYRPIVTSVTRTTEDVKNLRRRNGNASNNSTHFYGTTFDLSWKRFDKVDPQDPRDMTETELKHILALILREYRKSDRCYIKHEKRQACFHITARQQ